MNQSLENLFNKAVKKQISDFANQVLYDLCSTHFDHKEKRVVLAKIWLIGRSYAAAIERRRSKPNIPKIPNDEFYELVSKDFEDSDLGERLEQLKCAAGEQSISEEIILNILKTHKFLVELAKERTSLEKRSFASKYLHFHLPGLFFIYDSRAATSLQKIAKELSILISDEHKNITRSNDVDPTYAEFFLKAWSVQTVLETHFKRNMTTRQLDNLLIIKANADLKRGP